MARTLVLFGFLSVLALLATSGAGFLARFGPRREGEVRTVRIETDRSGQARIVEGRAPERIVPMRHHISLALLSSVLVLFTQSMVMFYFIGTGARVKAAWRRGLVPESAYRTSRAFHGRVFPLATGVTLLTMTLVILGGGVHTGVLHPGTHWALFLTAVPLNVWAVWRETLAMAENEALLNSLDDVLPPE